MKIEMIFLNINEGIDWEKEAEPAENMTAFESAIRIIAKEMENNEVILSEIRVIE